MKKLFISSLDNVPLTSLLAEFSRWHAALCLPYRGLFRWLAGGLLISALAGCGTFCTPADKASPDKSIVGSAAVSVNSVALPEGVEEIAIPTNAISTSPRPLKAFMFVPSGKKADERKPAVVMMHGCGGPYARSGQLGAVYRMWGSLLAEQGYLALVVDSFTSRDTKTLCTERAADHKIRQSDRVTDAYAALAYLKTRADVDPQRIALIGWSHGGTTTLDAIALPTMRPKNTDTFRAAIAFYPGCTTLARRPQTFRPDAPLLVLIGENDDWSSAPSCHQLAGYAVKAGYDMQVIGYPDTWHAFDNPSLKKSIHRDDVPNGVHPGQGVTIAPNPEAREDAKEQVLYFLNQNMPLHKDAR